MKRTSDERLRDLIAGAKDELAKADGLLFARTLLHQAIALDIVIPAAVWDASIILDQEDAWPREYAADRFRAFAAGRAFELLAKAERWLDREQARKDAGR